MQTEDLKILLALEPDWTVSIDGREFLRLHTSDVEVHDSWIRFGRYTRTILEVQWFGSGRIRVLARAKLRPRTEIIGFYPGRFLPGAVEALRRRRLFQKQISKSIEEYFKTRSIRRQTLHSDKRHSIGGAYPRFILGRPSGGLAVIAVDPDEDSTVVDGIVRAAVLWSRLSQLRTVVIVPEGRRQTIVTRLQALPALRKGFEWLQWDGEKLSRLKPASTEAETHVHEYCAPDVGAEVARLRAFAPHLLQAVPHIQGKAVSIRLRGIELARIDEHGTTYPLGEPLEPLIEYLDRERRHGSGHPLARAHEERWLESNLLDNIRQLLPVRQDAIYPQVPSFAGEERSIIDLLGIMENGRLAVIELKVSADPDLPFQAFDYWLAVERHRKAGDFKAKGYFPGLDIRDEPALLVLVAPLLAFHKTFDQLVAVLPKTLPLIEIGINQAWKRKIKILRRKGRVG